MKTYYCVVNLVKMDQMNLNVALVQFAIKWEDTEGNLLYLTRLFNGLKADTDLVVLPEMFHCGFSMVTQRNAQKDGGRVLEWMQKMSKRHNAAVVGSVVVELGGSIVNRLYVVDGEKITHYDKRHLFTMGGEHLHYQRGTKRLVVDVRGWKLCPLICYDLRFPVWSRNYDGIYDALIYVANWPESRINVWDVLLEARAIENQSYVIGVNRIGNDESLRYNGHSKVVDAKGDVVLNLADNNGIAYVALNKEGLKQFRHKFPVLRDGDNYSLSRM